jgi:hypothetical protein
MGKSETNEISYRCRLWVWFAWNEHKNRLVTIEIEGGTQDLRLQNTKGTSASMIHLLVVDLTREGEPKKLKQQFTN